MPNDDDNHNFLTIFKLAARSVTAAMVVLAGVTGLLWPKSSITAEDVIEPLPVKTLSFREGSPPVSQAPQKPPWLDADATPPPPTWTVRADGLWVPWTMQPPAWLSAIAQGYVVAETVPLPPERPAHLLKTEQPTEQPEMGGGVIQLRRITPPDTPKRPPEKRIARDGGLCEKHGLRQVWTDKYRWRCR
jgi:hypothetical protein